MENLSSNYLSRAETWLCLTTLIYFLMNGAQIFETFVFVPKWVESPPDHFALLLDGRGLSLKTFWIVLHSIHELTFLMAIVFCWKLDMIRNWLILLFIAHFAVRVWTLSYFAPHIIDFQRIAENPSLAKDLVSQTAAWQNLNYIRVGIFLAISIGMIPLCVKLLGMRS